MYVKLQNKYEGRPISSASHAICCTSGNVKVLAVAAGTLKVECSRLEYMKLNGPPALL
jgi:hypothetical protein